MKLEDDAQLAASPTDGLHRDDFDYALPRQLIAQSPVEPRHNSRLLHLDRSTGGVDHLQFKEIASLLDPGDMLVANDSRVIPARLFGRKQPTGGKVEILLLSAVDERCWHCLVGGKRLFEGAFITLVDRQGQEAPVTATVSRQLAGAHRELTFNQPLEPWLSVIGHTPLPPYISEPLSDPERYQTIYARPAGSAAAPTAGLHFSGDLLLSLRELGVAFETCTLHIGLDTFQPVAVDLVSRHPIHSEWASLSPAAAQRINETKLAGGRVIAIGTTAVRVLETAAHRSAGNNGTLQQATQLPPPDVCPWKPVAAFEGATDLFIYPGYTFRIVDALITNFHLPGSTLLMLVSALAGRERILDAYQIAVDRGYRFYSFGDAMFIS